MDAFNEWLSNILPKYVPIDNSEQLRELPLNTTRNAIDLGNQVHPLYRAPVARTFLTDILNVSSHQEGPKFCANMEMMLLHCLEQYGYERGMRLCHGYRLDLDECFQHNLEGMRNKVMMAERARQIKAGERKVPYEPTPSFDSI